MSLIQLNTSAGFVQISDTDCTIQNQAESIIIVKEASSTPASNEVGFMLTQFQIEQFALSGSNKLYAKATTKDTSIYVEGIV